MSRPKGSRNRRFVVPENLAEKAISEVDLETVEAEVEEKFKSFSASRDPNRVDDDEDEIPYYLKMMPEGSDKRKHLVAAAQAALILGTPVAQVANQFGIHPSKVRDWKDTLITVGAVGRRDRLSDMLMAYIEQEMKSLMSISIVTSSEDWIDRQSAGELAQFVAAKSDRLLMLLQAFGRVESSRQQYVQQLQTMSENG
jgi:transposase-like protein